MANKNENTPTRTNAGAKSNAAKPAESKVARTASATKPAESKVTRTASAAKPVESRATRTASAAKPAESKVTRTASAAKPVESKVTRTASAAKPVAKASVNGAKRTPATTAVNKPANAEKTKSAVKQSNVKKGAAAGKTASKGGAVAVTKNKKIAIIAIAAAFVCVLALVLGLSLGLKRSDPSDVVDDPFSDFTDLTVASVTDSHRNKTQVGYSGEIVGSVERYKPVEGVHSEEFSKGAYPSYGKTLSLTTEQKNELISLNRKLTANGTWVDASKKTSGSYDMMDKDGYLYKSDGTKPGDGVPERLYKHTASIGMYGGNVSDDEPAVVKNLTIRPRSYGSYYSVTGLYAPAGEVIKIQLTDADMNATSGLTIHIGQALYNGQANNIWAQRGVNRMPVILNTMNITKSTATYDEETGLWTGYVGSFLGGPIYVRSESVTFSVTVSGGVNYAHFILGVTTEKEYDVYRQSSAPYFDLEVWDRGVLHSGPVRKVKGFSYEDLYKAAILWEKIALVSTQNGTNQGVVFLYDPFVAAGAAVAFPGRRSVNCPEGWITGSLNYQSFVTSGSWGNVHEYNHNFQNYGLGSGADGEVTNNGLNLVAYSLFTKISAARGIAGYGGAGLSGWNRYTSASWALNSVNSGSITSTNGLAIYATLLHNFGQNAYLSARGASNAAYLNKWQNITHQDFSYFASMITKYRSLTPAATNYSLFVPVASVYQTGRTYQYAEGDKREITTMQPYVIPYGKPFTVDLRKYTNNSGGQYESGSVVIPKDFDFSVKSVKTDGLNGTFEETGTKGVYTFTPNTVLRSGKIYVTLEITTAETGTNAGGAHEWNGHKLDDVDLVLEFQQSQESNKTILERTIYTYEENPYTSATQAYEQGYAGYTTVETKDNKNYSQNSNTDIWIYPARYKDDPKYGQYVYPSDSVMELKGKLYFPQDGKYRIYLRGRLDCALFLSEDGGQTYFEAAHIERADNITTSAFSPNNEKTFYDIEIKEDETWIYFKEVLIVEPVGNNMSYVGLGLAEWVTPAYSAEVKYYFEDGTTKVYVTPPTSGNAELPDDAAASYDYTYKSGNVTYYIASDGTRFHYAGIEKVTDGRVTIQVETTYRDLINNTVVDASAISDELIPPAKDVTPTYVTAYREPYEFQKEFESDYFIVRNYNYNYVGEPEKYSTWDEGVRIVSCNKNPWSDTTQIDNLLTEGTDTFFHSNNAGSYQSGAMILELDMGKQISANSITFLGRTPQAATTAWQGLPNVFSLEVSMDGVNYTDAGSYTNSSIRNDRQVTVALDKAYKFRYVKIKIESTWSNNKHFVYSGIYFTHTFSLTGNGQNHISPDDARFTYKGSWSLAQTLSSFGHVYVGNSGAEMSFEYDASDGGRFAILSSDKYGQNYEVYIDGKKVDSVNVKDDPQSCAIRYISPELAEGKHSVVIKCVGEANIDSIAFY